MKKILSLISFVILISSYTSAQTSSLVKQTKSPLEGSWVSTTNDAFMIISNGFFSAIGKDSTGAWKETDAGTYKLENLNTVSLKDLYSSHPERINSIQTMGFDVSGETLTLKWFQKLLDPSGLDITAQTPRGVETKYVRAK